MVKRIGSLFCSYKDSVCKTRAVVFIRELGVSLNDIKEMPYKSNCIILDILL